MKLCYTILEKILMGFLLDIFYIIIHANTLD